MEVEIVQNVLYVPKLESMTHQVEKRTSRLFKLARFSSEKYILHTAVTSDSLVDSVLWKMLIGEPAI